MLRCWVIHDKPLGMGYLTSDDLSLFGHLPFDLKFVPMQAIGLEVGGRLDKGIRVEDEDLPPPDFAICLFETAITDVHYALLRQLELLNVFSLHRAEHIERSLNKFLTYQLLDRANIPIAATVLMTPATHVDWVVSRTGMPLVIKVPDGSKGEGVCLVHSQAELSNIHELYCKGQSRTLLAQEFIAASKGRDVRITVCDGEIVFGVLRDNSACGDFRSNLSVGGDGQFWEPDKRASDLALRVVDALDMKLCGVDLLFGPEGYVVGEVNSMPGCLHIQHGGLSNLQRLMSAIFRAVRRHL